MNSLAKPQHANVSPRTPGLVSYYNTEGAPPAGKVDIGANVLDVHDVNVPREDLARALNAGTGLTFKLVGSRHTHDVTLTPAQVGTLVATGYLELWSHFAALHAHPVRLSPGDGTAAHDVRLFGTRIAKTWVDVSSS